jgi:hypothetical protein
VSFEPEFLELMESTVTIFQATTKDFYGDSTFAASGQRMRAHITYKTSRVANNTGEPQTASATVILAGVVPNLDPVDKVVLPDGQARRVLDQTTYFDEDGPHHTTLKVA